MPLLLGSYCDTITYVDCFSGPWNIKSEDFRDSSFGIAIGELQKAREILERSGRHLSLRCFFLEKDRQAYGKLKIFTEQITDIEIQTKNKKLEGAINDITGFVQQGGSKGFSFIFIDPTGWTGFDMKVIAPLLRLGRSEVLINFMTGHINRFIESPEGKTHDSFERLFGSTEFQAKLQGFAKNDRDDAMVEAYTENVKQNGQFKHACAALILHPEKDRTHFHLIYATRNAKGVEVFKDIEKKSLDVMKKARSKAQKRKREERTNQTEMSLGELLEDSAYLRSLRERYVGRSKELITRLLQTRIVISYDDAWALALTVPMTWESDLKDWIKDWKEKGLIDIQGMALKQRVPQRGQQITLVWKQHLSEEEEGNH